MPSAKPLPDTETSTRLPCPIDLEAIGVVAVLERSSVHAPQEKIPRRLIPAAISRAVLGTVGRFALGIGTAFSDFLLTILFWVVAEFLAGCAAYAEAMHPANPVIDDRNDRGEATPGCNVDVGGIRDHLPETRQANPAALVTPTPCDGRSKPNEDRRARRRCTQRRDARSKARR